MLEMKKERSYQLCTNLEVPERSVNNKKQELCTYMKGLDQRDPKESISLTHGKTLKINKPRIP